MKLYNSKNGIFLEFNSATYIIGENWDTLINRDDLEGYLTTQSTASKKISPSELSALLNDEAILSPIGQQEVWAAGVTYLKSSDAVWKNRRAQARQAYMIWFMMPGGRSCF